MNSHMSVEFPETADIETSSDDYARRFAGPIGVWMLDVQKRWVLRFAKAAGGKSVLDVGGGHGQLAIPMMEAGYEVTVLGSAPSCVNRLEPHVSEGRMRFVVGNVIELPFADHSFDLAVSVRLLTHCSRWPQLVRELCRVASRAVIVDYPVRHGFNALASFFFGAKKRLEGNTRTWRDFTLQEVDEAFLQQGYVLVARAGQFFWPMVLHRVMKSVLLSRCLEWPFQKLGLTRRWGSPVIAWYMPQEARASK